MIFWLTGYDTISLQKQIDVNATFEVFFAEAPQMNPLASMITGSICGVKIEEIQDPLYRNIRYLDKLVDELAKGKNLEKIFDDQPLLVDLLSKCLEIDPRRRISCEEALNHPFF